ncbi:MAG: ATP-binding protein [Cyanobacteria bacterium J06597_16]
MVGRSEILKRFKQAELARSGSAARVFANLSIGRKLNVGFGLLVAITFLVVGRNYWGSLFATSNIDRTQQVRVPTTLASNRAQTLLLEMSADLRGYLITGKSEFRNRYYLNKQAFDRELVVMVSLLEGSALPQTNAKLAELQRLYQQWNSLPDELFALSDQYVDNQPALKLFRDQGDLSLIKVQARSQSMIEAQALRSPSVQNTQQLKELAAFQNSFALLGASLRAYLLTQNSDFRFEYAGYLRDNTQQWDRVNAAAASLSPAQRQDLESLKVLRQQFLALVPRVLDIVEGDRYREDLYLFTDKAEPLASEMLLLLEEIVSSQQQQLDNELVNGRQGLATAQWQTLLGSFLAMAIALLMAILLRRKIADPIVRLTQATAQVMEGDFDVKAVIESDDEIGTLAKTFNCMTDYLKAVHESLESTNRTLAKQKSELLSKNIQINQALDALQATQAQLIQTEKMSGLGQMVAGIAHEINNPVSFIHGNLPCAQEYVDDLIDLLKLYQQTYPQGSPAIFQKTQSIDLAFLLDDVSQIFDSMETGTERIRDIVKSLRNFSRLDESEMKLADLEEGLNSTLLILQNRLGLQPFRPAIDVVKDYGNLPRIECYPGELNQVFLNILANAIDAIDAIAHAQSKSQAQWQPQLIVKTAVEGAQVLVSIADNGEGIDLSTQSRIFDPFFTTKPVGTGTGMGLSIAHKIVVDRHKGDLSCESLPGEGTTFSIEVPQKR